MGQTKRTPELELKYLELVEATGLVQRSARGVGIDPATMCDWRNDDPDWDDRVLEAMEYHREHIEAAVHKRAIEGITTPVFFQGVQTDTKIEYSDRMLELYAKRHIGAYRDKHQVDHNFKGGVLVVPGLASSSEAWEEEENGESKTDAKGAGQDPVPGSAGRESGSPQPSE